MFLMSVKYALTDVNVTLLDAISVISTLWGLLILIKNLIKHTTDVLVIKTVIKLMESAQIVETIHTMMAKVVLNARNVKHVMLMDAWVVVKIWS